MIADIFAEQDDILGEGPLWVPSEQALYWLDIGRKRLHRRTLQGQCQRWELPARPGCVEQLAGGDLVLTFGQGVHRFEAASADTQLLRTVSLEAGVRFNEGKADPRGRLWFGSMQDDFGPNGPLPIERSVGTLFRLDTDGSLAAFETGVGISNTLAWSPDERRLYFADSLLDQIYVYDYDVCDGVAFNKRLFFKGINHGLPDGSAMDVDGCLWNTRWGAGMILRITPEGQIDRCIKLPVPQPSSCAFGGPNLDTLFVTSARNGMSVQSLACSPLSGSVFAIEGTARGVPVGPMRWEAT